MTLHPTQVLEPPANPGRFRGLSCPATKQIQFERSCNRRNHHLRTHAVSRLVKRRGKASNRKFTWRDRKQTAAHAAFAGKTHGVCPIPRSGVEAFHRHFGEKVGYVCCRCHALPRPGVHASIRKRGPHRCKIDRSDKGRALPGVHIDGSHRIAVAGARAEEQPANCAVVEVGALLGGVYSLTELDVAPGKGALCMQDGGLAIICRLAGHKARGGNRAGVHRRRERLSTVKFERHD